MRKYAGENQRKGMATPNNHDSASTIVFLSHAAADQAIAGHLKHVIETCFPQINVFVSSDPEDLPPGDPWVQTVLANLNLRMKSRDGFWGLVFLMDFSGVISGVTTGSPMTLFLRPFRSVNFLRISFPRRLLRVSETEVCKLSRRYRAACVGCGVVKSEEINSSGVILPVAPWHSCATGRPLPARS